MPHNVVALPIADLSLLSLLSLRLIRDSVP
jgi:hypothetical protein